MIKKVFALAVIILILGMVVISLAEMKGDAAAGKMLTTIQRLYLGK